MTATQFKLHALIKCCNVYPRYHTANGMTWVQCPECGNRSQTYLTAGLSANKGWNEKRERQLKVENITTGKPHWYKEEE